MTLYMEIVRFLAVLDTVLNHSAKQKIDNSVYLQGISLFESVIFYAVYSIVLTEKRIQSISLILL